MQFVFIYRIGICRSLFKIFLCMGVSPPLLSVHHVHAEAAEARRKRRISLELELQIIVNHHVIAGS